jgi:mycothiol system anti-sigma-R factor
MTKRSIHRQDLTMHKTKPKTKFNCKDIEKKFHSYLDGELDESDLLLLEQHLDYCLPCDKKIEFEKKLREILKSKVHEKKVPDKLLADLKKIIQSA